eukprot:GHVS01029945.1.p1 GENE.GHVS01029945.1~~GHVS01029945.1.p1  ORF type:complete len:228 (-),score=27.78 GHVS01029945.1:790-1473(-)
MEETRRVRPGSFAAAVLRRYKRTTTSWQQPNGKKASTAIQPKQQPTYGSYRQDRSVIEQVTCGSEAIAPQRVWYSTEEWVVEQFHPSPCTQDPALLDQDKNIRAHSVSPASTKTHTTPGCWSGGLWGAACSSGKALSDACHALRGVAKYVWDNPRCAVVVLLCALVVLLVCLAAVLSRQHQQSRKPGLVDLLASKLHLVVSPGQGSKYLAKTVKQVLQILLTEDTKT